MRKHTTYHAVPFAPGPVLVAPGRTRESHLAEKNNEGE